ncbi:DNA translocase FtsK [Bacillus sp. V3B]|uniref:DNA translocase FtsK n=1 Tax=Bacillus sp. V3B TaxID=2804915 RepID=UPI0021095D18|nr:DNA translocase FtsK [Bacillus sp. V3B]MCQ6274422.1 DNA translocase FtsK [Bacillus sp. V3B]
MSWIQRLFRFIKDKEVENIEEDLERTPEVSKNITTIRQKGDSGRAMEAKIAYHYPKGAFRFPLIPDEDKSDEDKSEENQTIANKERKKEPYKASQKKDWNEKRKSPQKDWNEKRVVPQQEWGKKRVVPQQEWGKKRVTPQKEWGKKREVPQQSPDIQESVVKKKTPEKEKRGTRAFKPTRIPSPIYGFKERPEHVNDVSQVEFELKPLEKKVPFTQEPLPFHDQQKDEVSVLKKNTVITNESKLSEDQAVDLDRLEIVEVNNGLPKGATEGIQVDLVTEKDFEVIEKLQTAVVKKGQFEFQLEEVEDVVEEIQLEKTNEDDSEVTIASELTVFSEGKIEEVEANGGQPGLVDDTQNVVQEKEVENLENDTQTVVQEEEALKLENVIQTAIREEEVTIEADTQTVIQEELVAEQLGDDQTIGEHEITEKSIQSEQETPPISSNESSKGRSPIPFNVIMLQQDKRMIELKNQKTAVSESLAEVVKKESLQVAETGQMEDINYLFPSFQLLTPPVVVEENNHWIEEQKALLDTTLKNFNVGAGVVNVTQGPSVTRFEVQPEPGVKVNKITNLSDDIKLSLAARDIRVEAPIPGKHTIGIEVPNEKSRPVLLSEIVNSPEFNRQASPLTAALGLDISGKPIVTDLRKMPHGLIAGATGSGKSVCINTILVSLLYKATPEEVKLLLIDPKMVELAPYNYIPHLVSPVITDVKAATAALKWAVEEMERRYELFAHTGVRDISRFNELAEKHKQYADKLPYMVIVIDELADLMMMSPADVEEAICRIAQKARACGIHLIIATQRPSVDVITGLIKANIPTRIAFSVSSQVDSRTIIDMSGAEKLLGKGDMLFLENGSSKSVRLQGTFVSDEEIDEVVAHVREQGEPNYLFEQEELLKKAQISEEEDELFYEACEFVIEHGGASSSLLQRRFKIGYNRAARLIDMMEQQGYISEARGSKPRDVFITDAELETLQ